MAIAPVSFALGRSDPDRFARELGESFERFGFAVIADHGLDQGVIDRALVSSKAFFALPEEVKRRYFVEGGAGQRGYTPFGVEVAKGHEHVDLKEFWHVGRELPAGHPSSAVMPANLWPSEIESFKADVYGLFCALDDMGATMLAAIARHLGEAEDFFVDPVRDGNSILRLLHYPPMPANTGGRIRAGAHEDINRVERCRPVAGRPRVQCGRHAAAPHRWAAAVHQPPGDQSGAGTGELCPLLHALLPAFSPGLSDHAAGELRDAGAPGRGAHHR
jgi:isopenicillin N synthase-like dioxygenase